MQGTEGPDRELLDVLGLCGALVREGSVYRFLAENRLVLFPDGLFADGRLWWRPQAEGCSEGRERLRCDLRWKAAAGLAVVPLQRAVAVAAQAARERAPGASTRCGIWPRPAGRCL